MKKVCSKLTLALLMLLSIVFMIGATVPMLTAKRPEAAPASAATIEEGAWYSVDSSETALTVLFTADTARLADVTREEIATLKNDLVAAMQQILIDGLLDNVPAAHGIATVDLEIPGIPEEITKGGYEKFRDYVKERLSSEEELEKYLNGEYDVLIKYAANEYVQQKEEAGEEPNVTELLEKFKQEVNQLVDEVIEEVYDGDTDAIEHAKELSQEATDRVAQQVEEGNGEITMEDVRSALRSVSVDAGNGYVPIYVNTAEGEFGIEIAGVKEILLNLPRPSDIINRTDDEMRLDYGISVETGFGSVAFSFTVGLEGDSSSIRSFIKRVTEYVDFYKTENGTYTVNVRAPQPLQTFLLKVANTGRIPDTDKNKIFSLFGKTSSEIFDQFAGYSYDELLDLLKSVDYKTLFNNVFSAELINGYFADYGITADRVYTLIDKIFAAFARLDNYSKQDIKDFFSKYVPELATSEKFDNAAGRFVELLDKIDFTKYDAEFIKEVCSEDSAYTNENFYAFIDRFANYEDLYNTLLGYAEDLFNALPEKVKNGSVLDLYKGSGELAWNGEVKIDLNNIFERISNYASRKGYDSVREKLNGVLASLDQTVFDFKASINVSVPNVHKITYVAEGTEIRSGLLPEGANVLTFANVTEWEDGEIVAWEDENGNVYNEESFAMPAGDVVLNAVVVRPLEVTVEWPEVNSFVFTAEAQQYLPTVTLNGEYSAEELLDIVYEGTEETNAGEGYTAKVTITVKDPTRFKIVNGNEEGVYESEATWSITKAEIDLSGAAIGYSRTEGGEYTEYTDETALVYDGNAYWFGLIYETDAVDVEVVWDGEGWTGTNAGTYTIDPATIALDGANKDNYTIVGLPEEVWTWTIEKAEIDLGSAKLGYSRSASGALTAYTAEANLTYDGAAFYFGLMGFEVSVSGIEVVWSGEGWTGTNAGTYTIDPATVTLDGANKDNYTIVGLPADGWTWSIAKQTIDFSGTKLVYSRTQGGQTADFPNNYTVTYDGNDYFVEITGYPTSLPEGVSIGRGGEGWTGKVAGNYTITISLQGVNSENYSLVGFVTEWSWTIAKATVDVTSYKWNYSEPFTYDGTAKTVEIESTISNFLNVTYTNNSKTEAGAYTATATFTVKEAYDANSITITGSPLTLSWEIKAQADKPDPGEDEPKPGDKGETYPGADGKVSVEDKTGAAAGSTLSTQELSEKDLGKVDYSNVLGKRERAKLGAAYDIHFEKDGAENKVNGTFVVRLAIPEDLRDGERNLKVVYIDENGVATEVDPAATRDGDYMQFTAEHFSIYAVIEVTKAPNLWWLWLLIAIIIILLIIIIILLIIIKKKNSDEEEEEKVEEPAEPEAEKLEAVEENTEPEEPVEEAPVDEVPEEPVEEAPVEEEPVEEEPEPVPVEAVEEIPEEPVEEAPVEEVPVEEEPVVEEPVEEAPAEEEPVIVPVVEETPVEEPVEEAPAEEPAPIAEIAVAAAATATAAAFILPASEKEQNALLNRSFTARLIQSDAETQSYYSEIKNAMLSYKGVKSRMSWGFDTFNRGRDKCAKIQIRGKSLVVYYALDPESLNPKYHHKNVSDKSKYAAVPTMLKVKSKRSLKYALELVDVLMGLYEIPRTDKRKYDYTREYKTTEQLIQEGLIKFKRGAKPNFEKLNSNNEEK